MIKISLTKKGYKAYANALEMESIRDIFSVLSKKKQKQLYSLLEELRSSALKSLFLDENAAILRLKLAQSNTKTNERVIHRKLENS
jgi:DNA-binding MarR family transcriptional regulator